jgi:probable rRNA maturation factor
MKYEIFTEKNIRINKKDIDKVIKKFVKLFNIPQKINLSIALVSPEEIKNLNYKYRKKNKATDVLSFGNSPLARGVISNQKESFFDQNYIGEIIICYEQAQTQAKEAGVKLKDEINRLLAHGLVHLMGYDHKTKAEEDKMKIKEKKILSIE